MFQNSFYNLRKDILLSSYQNGWAHIPSAFSHVDYINNICETLDPQNTKIVFGKPFGAQGYYIPFKRHGFIDSFDFLSEGVKINELKKRSKYPDLFEFSEETIGNALGVAIGVAMTNHDKIIWCNISDASLQMGQTLEALLFIFEHSRELPNLNVTIDYNGWQVLSELTPDVTPIIEMIYKSDKINAEFLNGHDFTEDAEDIEVQLKTSDKANFYVFSTVKGKGVTRFEKNPEYWHYQTIDTTEQLEFLTTIIYD